MTFARDLANFADVSANNLTFRNVLINGAMNVWQRGTSIAFGAAAYQYMQDRWRFVRGSFAAGATISRQTTSDTTNLPNIQYCARIQRDSGNTSTQYLEITQAVESANSVPFIGKSVVLSFYARAGANYSSSSNALSALVSTGTGTDQAYNSFTNLTSVINQTATLTTTWQRFSYTGTVGLTATQIGVLFRYTPVGTAGANDYFEITGVQLEAGSSASAFETRPVGTELALCQRYYFRESKSSGSNIFSPAGMTLASNRADLTVVPPVPMRVFPTAIDFSNLKIQDSSNGQFSFTSVVIDFGNERAISINGTCTGAVTGRAARIIHDNSANASYLGFSAEL